MTGDDFGRWRRNRLPEAMSVHRRQTQGKTVCQDIEAYVHSNRLCKGHISTYCVWVQKHMLLLSFVLLIKFSSKLKSGRI